MLGDTPVTRIGRTYSNASVFDTWPIDAMDNPRLTLPAILGGLTHSTWLKEITFAIPTTTSSKMHMILDPEN
jgi:hypothetical protein